MSEYNCAKCQYSKDGLCDYPYVGKEEIYPNPITILPCLTYYQRERQEQRRQSLLSPPK